MAISALSDAHLPLVLVAQVAAVGGDVAEGLLFDRADPFLAQPRRTGQVEHVGHGRGGLVAVIDPLQEMLAMLGDEVVLRRQLELLVKRRHVLLRPAEEPHQARHVVGHIMRVDRRVGLAKALGGIAAPRARRA